VAVLGRPQIEYRTPLDLVAEVRSGVLRIPPFQRGFKWDSRDVVALFDSVAKGYPIGNLLLWRRPAPAQQLRVGAVDVDAPALDSALWVVDGQQRITALVSGLVAAETTVDDRFRVHLDVESGSFHTPNPRQEVPASWLPVSILADTARLLRWMRENEAWLTEESMAFVEQTAKAIREYQIPAYVVTSADELDLMEIFARINTTGRPLTQTEVFQALHLGTVDQPDSGLRYLVNLPAQLGFGSISDELALECVKAYLDDERDVGVRLTFASRKERREVFGGVATALRHAVEFLQQVALIPHVRLIWDVTMIPTLVRYIRHFGPPHGRAATLLRRWVWRDLVSAYSIGMVFRFVTKNFDTRDALSAVESLLQRVSYERPLRVDLRVTGAAGNVGVLTLLAMGPQEPSDGRAVDVNDLMAREEPWRMIVADGPETFANLVTVVAPELSDNELRDALARADPEIAQGHLIDETSQRYLREGRDEEFFQRRGEAVKRAIESQVRRMAEWGARDGKSISEILRAG
jgi:hypothetical protein